MEQYFKDVNRILMIILILNILVASIKIFYGMHSNILSITSDGYDSLFDAVSNIVGILAIYLASKPMDKEHNYGHSKIETFASLLIVILLFLVSYDIATSAIERFSGTVVPSITVNSFIVLIVTLLINLAFSRYERRKGLELNSDLLISDSKHTMSDVLATAVILVGLVFMRMGLTIVDPILSIFIALLILRTAIDILINNLNILLDKSVMTDEEIKDALTVVEQVNDIHNIRTRGTPSQVFVDMHIVVDGNLTVEKSHVIAHECENEIKSKYPNVIDVLIHVEPEEGLKDKITYS